MFLKSLEIRGFKSFADKTELKFNEGITAVVGPNGSGKSNVSDAVRWVLGEQSARTLRGSKMEDIIFTGTEYRKPIGFAQVSLTLDNSDEELPIDYSDVKVTRRIFRSGESEYLINNSQCRLKDITTLFMDTGIGKEGYSLIGQGKIDAILSGKPEERRTLLEEAAGIVKFKSRKVEAERKLDNTRENLVRINDIIFTYEERLGPLEVEKNKAIEYMELASKLQKSEVALIINNLMKLEVEIKTQRSKISELININTSKKEEYKNKREQLSNLKRSLEELENNYSAEQKQYFFKKENISKSLSEIELLQERIKNIEESIDKNEKEIEESNSKLEVLVKEKDILEKEYAENKKIYEEFNNKIEDIECKVKALVSELQEKEKRAQNLKDTELQLLRDISTAKNKKVLLESELNTLEENISYLKGNQEKFENSLKINLATKVNLEKEHSAVLIKKDEISASIDAKNNEKQQLENKITEIQKQLNRVSSELHRVEANKEILKKLESQYEGYNVSVKKIMESINSGKLSIDKSKCVVFGEAIKTSKGYETAIEISLGAAISNIITEDEVTAKYLISYLKNNRLGRATFLPLSTIRANKLVLNKDIMETKGCLGIASDLVEYDVKYQNVVNNILGKTIICDNIDNALVIAKKIQYRNRIVTLSGEVVNAGGALTGGSVYQKNMGIMSRKTEFEALEKKIETITNEREKVVKSLENSIKTRESLECARQELVERVYATNLEAADVRNKINNIDEEVLKLKNSFKIVEFELKTSKEKINSTESQLNIILEKVEEFEALEISNKETLEELNIRIKEISSAVSDIRDSSTDLRIKKAQVEESIEGKNKEINRNKRELEELKSKIVSLKSYVDQNSSVRKESLDKIEFNSIFIKDEKNELILLEENAKTYELNKAKLKEEITNIEGSLEIITVEVAKKDDEIHRNEIIFTKQENERNIYFSRLNEEFNTTYEEAKKDFVPIVNIDEHRQGVNRLKNKISSLGVVNVNAIEEFKELSEKYRFITTEKEDLEKAQEELVNVIEEMTSKMRVVFRQNFTVLNRYFDETFKELFKGGSAKLLLADGDELTGNIEINVQPPGKKVQNINLMSGGEKVLSAIAILFAILKMKPTPFCILDEIEAALDDANVNRYADFLRKFSHNIQFIVITHRKGTMEAADVMYGVTMEERGVSKVVSVDLSK